MKGTFRIDSADVYIGLHEAVKIAGAWSGDSHCPVRGFHDSQYVSGETLHWAEKDAAAVDRGGDWTRGEAMDLENLVDFLRRVLHLTGIEAADDAREDDDAPFAGVYLITCDGGETYAYGATEAEAEEAREEYEGGK